MGEGRSGDGRELARRWGHRRRWRVLAVLVLVAGLIVGAGAAWSPATETRRCDRFTALAEARRAIVTGHGRDVLVVGDSYAAGLGLRDPGNSWPRDLPGRITVAGFAGSGFSAGASGCRAVSFGERTEAAVRALHPDLLVVQGGLNDVDQPSAAIRSGVRRVLAAAGEVPVVIVGPPSAPERAYGIARVDRLLAAEAARGGAAYLPMRALRLAYLHDDLHLTPQGHRDFGAEAARGLADPGR